MENIVNRINQTLEKENRLEELENLVYELKAEGLNRTAIYNLFLNYYNSNNNSEVWNSQLDNGDHPIELTLDRIWGWCPSDRIFDLD